MAQYPGRLESANTKEFGIVSAVEIAGHRTVKTIDELYAISDAILSESKNNTNNDAIGQEWFVISENEYYRLINWENRKSSTGWAAQPRPDSLNTKLDEEVVRAKAAEDKIEASVGLNTDGSHKKTTGNYTGQANTITEEISALDTEAKKINDSLASHTSDKSNPHSVTKAQVGLGNVDDTADMDKPVSKAQSTADKKVADDAAKNLKAHTDKVDNPHNVTKEQLGLGNVTNDAQVKRSEMGVARGVATLDESGLVPSSQLPSFVDDVLEFDNLTSFPTKGESGKIYVDTTTNLTYRWTGSTYVEISKSIALGETSSTAYPGDKGVETANKLKEHIASKGNPHGVTKAQIGLGSVENIAPTDLPLSKAVVAELNKKVDKTVTVNGRSLDANITLTKNDIGLENVENLSSLNLPVSTATQAALDKKVDKTITVNGHALSANVVVTKDDINLGNVDNTADLNKPISTATQTALNKKVDKENGKELITTEEKKKLINLPEGTVITAHFENKTNPHEVTKEQVGLGKVDDTADLDKPISKATQTALDNKAEKTVTVNGHSLSTNITLTKADIGLENVENIAPVSYPVSSATKTELDKKVDKVPGQSLITDAEKSLLKTHTESKTNPHGVTKEQIGLGKVEDTADLDKPISTATQTALDKKVDKVEGSTLILEVDLTNLKSHLTNKENPHGVTKEQVGLGNVDNTADLNKPISTATQEELNLIKRVTSEGLATLCDKIRDNDEILADVINTIISRLTYLESKVR